MKVCFDANILMEVIDERLLKSAALRLFRRHQDSLNASALSGHLVMYFGAKSGHSIGILQGFLADFQLMSLTQVAFDWAWANRRNDDFEDALQIASAVHAGCEVFYTLDKKLVRDYQNLPQIDVVLLEEGIC